MKQPFDILTIEHVPQATIYIIPQDVKEAILMQMRAAQRYNDNEMSPDDYLQVHAATQRVIEDGAKRCAMISNIGE